MTTTEIDRFATERERRHQFPWHPMLVGSWAPWPMEGEISDVPVVKGKLPDDLVGSYFKTSPNPRYLPLGGQYHGWAADAMVHGITFTGDRVTYRNRWIRTPKFLAEGRAGRSVFDYIMPDNPFLFSGLEPYRDTPETEGVAMISPMTAVIYWKGQLLAFGEGDTPPWALDPWTLDSFGPADFARHLPAAFNPRVDGVGAAMGHMRYCPVTHELFMYTISISEPYFTLHVLSRDGGFRSIPLHDAPFASYIHDFMISGDHVIVSFSPVLMSYDRVRQGGGFFAWEPDLGTHVAVISRQPGNEVTWIDLDENCYVTHPVNAYEEDGKIIHDFPHFPVPPITTENSFAEMVGIMQGDLTTPLVRWEIDVAARKITQRQLGDRGVELPRINDSFQGQPYRVAYLATRTSGSANGFDFNVVLRQDMVTGEAQMFEFPEAATISEPVFCPRAGATAEDDGYLLVIAYRPETDKSELYLLDAADIEAGPVAVVGFPHRIPMPSHGTWTAATP